MRDADRDRIRDASWLLRALRQRARTYEKVVGAIAELRPRLAIADKIDAVPVREIAEKIGMHESTITRVASAVRWQNRLGVFGLAAGKRGIVVAA